MDDDGHEVTCRSGRTVGVQQIEGGARQIGGGVAKRAWSQATNAAVSFGHSVRNSFTTLGEAGGTQ